MNPLAIRAENYRTFEQLDLPLPGGCVAVVGPNGNGKSSIVNVIDLALFGPESRTLADQLTDDAAGTELMLELTFEHGGQVYRARRGYSARGAGKQTLDLERFETGEAWVPGSGDRDDDYVETSAWMPLTLDKAKETQAEIERLLGMSRDTFRASAFLKQRDGGAFTEATPARRKEILADVLGLDHWDAYLDRARADRKRAEQELATLRSRLQDARQIAAGREQIESDLATHTATETDAKALLADAERSLEEATAAYQDARARLDAITTAEAELRASTATLEALQKTAADAEQARAEIGTIDPLIAEQAAVAADLDDRQASRDTLARLRDERQTAAREREQLLSQTHERLAALARRAGETVQLRDKAESLRLEASMLEQASGDTDHTCDRCGQHLDQEARARATASYRQEADGLEAQAAEIDEWAATEKAAVADLAARAESIHVDDDQAAKTLADLAAAETRLQAARGAQVDRAKLQERRKLLERHAAAGDDPEFQQRLAGARSAVATATGNLDAARAATPADLDTIVATGAQARELVNMQRGRLTSAQTEKARCEERLARIVEAEEKIAAGADRDRELVEEINVCSALERAYGRDGIPALIVESAAVPQIEAEANRILEMLPCGDGTVFRVELHTQAARKSGDGLKDVLDIVVYAPGGERAYETFSEGEKTRLNVALRIALASLLAARRGADSRCLIVDEPEFLDEQGTQALAAVLRDLVNGGRFDKVYLVSHVPSLRDAFDQVVEVSKVGNRSRVVVPELAVAA